MWLRILDSPYILSLWIYFIVWLVPWGSSSETQRQLVVRMLNVRPRDILGQKYTSGAREPVENHQSNSSRSVRNRSRWLARKIILWPIIGKVLQDDSVTILHKLVFLIDPGTCSWLARTKWIFSRTVSGEGHWGSSEHRNYLKKFRQIPQNHTQISPNILTHQSAESKLEMNEINISSLLITFNMFETTGCCVKSEFYSLLFQMSPDQVLTSRAAAWPNKQRNGNAATRPLVSTWPGDSWKCFIHSAYKICSNDTISAHFFFLCKIG